MKNLGSVTHQDQGLDLIGEKIKWCFRTEDKGFDAESK